MKNMLFGADILSVEQFSARDVDEIFSVAGRMKKLVGTKGMSSELKGKVVTALFYEPSSRTFGSFVAAIQRLGGGFIPLQGVTYSSVTKGETLADTVRTFASFSDAVIIRHPEAGSAKIAAEFCPKPVINAGDGVGEHPTQALLDLFTIKDRLGSISGLTITMVGDMLNGRTVHSLAKLLAMYGKKLTMHFVSPDILRMPREILDKVHAKGVTVHERQELSGLLPETDVLYVTRVQKERFSDLASYEKVKHFYIVTPTMLKKFRRTGIVMHPLPRVGEITMDVDMDARAAYITDQMKNGMYVRMAVLALVLGKKNRH